MIDIGELRKLHGIAKIDVPLYKGEGVSDAVREFANAAHDALPELLDEIERLRAATQPCVSGMAHRAFQARIAQLEAALREIDLLTRGTLPLTAQIKEIGVKALKEKAE